jgi:AraC-like DNA-binding protein
MEPTLYIGITQSLFTGIILITKKPETLSNRILAAWLFLITFDMILALIVFKVDHIFLFTTVPFAYGPLLYFYIQSLTHENLRIKKSFVLHFIPFVIFFILSLNFRELPITNTASFLEEDSYTIFRFVYGVAIFVSITGYSIFSYISILRYQKNLKDLSAFTSGEITLNWLKIITILFFAAYILMFITGGIQVFGRMDTFEPTIVSYVGLTVFAFLISFYGIRQPVLFGLVLSDDEKRESSRYERSGLSDAVSKEYLTRLQNYLQDEKPFFESELTIHDLSNKLDISRHHLTQVINEKLNKNFYTFINEYRLEEFKKRLIDPKYNNLTVLAIAYDSGFNSKSTFNNFFKKVTGMTPSQYKKSVNQTNL